jgi:DNA segregation ATPase FtsK/SpoIIIE, S-DNA-T family
MEKSRMTDQRERGGELVPRGVPYEVDAEILTGEIVGDQAPAPVRVIHAVRVVARHEHSKAVARNLAYVPIGVYAVICRLWDSRSTARYERFMRSAERTGDHESALEWESRAAAFRRDRHQRRMDWLERPARIALLLPKILAGLFAVLAAIGVFLGIATRRLAEIAVPFEVVGDVVKWVVIAVSVSYGPVLLSLPWIGLAALWWTGRRHANDSMTGWAAAPAKDDADGGIVVTADTIVVALQNLRVPELKRAFRDGWRPVFHTQPVRDGRGYAAVFGLPLGVTAAMIADQRPVLARNVHRAEVEVWPSDAEKAGTGPAGTVALWIADSGVLSRPAPEYPLMHDGTADVFRGVPAGISPRGDEISVPIVANNAVFGGQMGQGKSNACRVVMLGCALDPLAELDVFVFANNGDFDAYQPRLARYVKGLEDDTIEAAVARLRGLYAEVGRPEARLSEMGAKKVTRGLAEAQPDMPPRPPSAPARPGSRSCSTPSPAARRRSRRSWSNWSA